jgi:hypothetical protein
MASTVPNAESGLLSPNTRICRLNQAAHAMVGQFCKDFTESFTRAMLKYTETYRLNNGWYGDC